MNIPFTPGDGKLGAPRIDRAGLPAHAEELLANYEKRGIVVLSVCWWEVVSFGSFAFMVLLQPNLKLPDGTTKGNERFIVRPDPCTLVVLSDDMQLVVAQEEFRPVVKNETDAYMLTHVGGWGRNKTPDEMMAAELFEEMGMVMAQPLRRVATRQRDGVAAPTGTAVYCAVLPRAQVDALRAAEPKKYGNLDEGEMPRGPIVMRIDDFISNPRTPLVDAGALALALQLCSGGRMDVCRNEVRGDDK